MWCEKPKKYLKSVPSGSGERNSQQIKEVTKATWSTAQQHHGCECVATVLCVVNSHILFLKVLDTLRIEEYITIIKRRWVRSDECYYNRLKKIIFGGS